MNQVSATAACCGEQASHEELLGRLDGVLEDYRGKPGAGRRRRSPGSRAPAASANN